MDDQSGHHSASTEGQGDGSTVSDEVFSLFILKSNVNSLSQAETFLKNRGWKIASGTDLRQALAYIIQNQPQYVMISVDHPNKKVRALPKLLAQAFPVKIVAFAEYQTNNSIKGLHEMRLEYSLFPPVSGPSIDRMIRKIKKDEEASPSSDPAARFQQNSDGQNQGSNTMTFSGGSFEQARAALSQLVNNDQEHAEGSVYTNGSDSLVQSGTGTFVAKGQGSQVHDYNGQQGGMQGPNHYNPNNPGSGPNGPNSHYDPNNPDAFGGYHPGAQQVGKGPQGQTQGFSPGGMSPRPPLDPNSPAEGESFDQWSERMRKLAQNSAFGDQQNPEVTPEKFDQLKKQREAAKAAGNDETSDWQGMDPGLMTPEQREAYKNNFEAQARAKKQAPVMESNYQPKKVRPTPTYRSGGVKKGSDDSIIVRGTQQALDETVELTDENAKIQAVEKTSNVACITVESPKFSGYLVCALGKNRKIDKKMIDTIQKKLFAFLKANGEKLTEDDTMNVKLKEVEFEDWAISQADFLRKSIHNGEEIAMAFFPTKDVNTKLEESASEKMLKMDLKDIKADTALEFDLYVYMPENNKYILYTPQGMVFYGNQKDRLQEKGVAHMHLRKDSVHNVRKYKAQNYLNDKIAEYKALLAKTPAAS